MHSIASSFLIILITLFLPVATPPVLAENGSRATLTETMDWLKGVLSKEKCSDFLESGGSIEWEGTTLKYEGGILELTTRLARPGREGWSGYEKRTVPLNQLDLLTVRQSGSDQHWYVTVNCSRGGTVTLQSRLYYTGGNPYCVVDQKENGLLIHISSQEMAERVTRALTHAIKLSGARVDPF